MNAMSALDRLVDDAVAALPRGRRGNPSAPPSIVREITAEDLPNILARPAPPPASRPLARIRHTHHLAARLLAEGRAPVEVAAVTGYSPERINQLQKDPSFMELVAHYKQIKDAKWLNIHERLAALGVSISEELQERLEQDPESFTTDELRKLMETTLDRGGFGPRSTRDITVRSQSLAVNLIEQIKLEGKTSNVRLLEDQSQG